MLTTKEVAAVIDDQKKKTGRWWVSASEKKDLFPGKHSLYSYGQSSYDGDACICDSFQSQPGYSQKELAQMHDEALGVEHNHNDWLPISGDKCPCE